MANYTNHPGTAALLDYLDGAGAEQESLHIQQCKHCLNELEQLCTTRANLARLPLNQPPETVWHSIQSQTRPATGYANRFTWLAAAASLMLVVGLMLPLIGTDDQVLNTEYASLLEESRQLESALAYFDRRPTVVNLGAAGQIARYKDSIAAVDLALNEQAQSEGEQEFRNTLMRERIRLMRNLVKEQAQPMLASYQAF